MYAAKSLEDEQTSVLDEVVQAGDEEEVIHEDRFAVPELLLGTVEVEIDIQAFDEFRDRISICV